MDAVSVLKLVACEVQGCSGESSEICYIRFCKMLNSNDDERTTGLSKQQISMALQIDNAACVPGTVSDRYAFEEIYYIWL